MKGRSLILVVLIGSFIFCQTNQLWADLTIGWETDLYFSQENRITRIKLTPDKQYVMVFHNHAWTNSAPGDVEKLDADTGELIWAKQVNVLPERVSESAWVDEEGYIYIGAGYNGNKLWKFDAELNEIWPYPPSGASFEYIKNIIVDDLGCVYVSGSYGTGSGQPSSVLKLNGNVIPPTAIWNVPVGGTPGYKDHFGHSMTLDSNRNLYRVGWTAPGGPNPLPEIMKGRIVGHNSADGSIFLNWTVDENCSSVYGVIVDSSDNPVIAYTYDLYHNGSNMINEYNRSVVQKLDPWGNSVWKYVFEDTGIFFSQDCMVKNENDVIYVSFNQYVEGSIYPGIAALDMEGNLLWMDIINFPGWLTSFKGSIDTDGTYIYLGISKYGDYSQNKVLQICTPTVSVDAVIDIDPDTLNQKSKGRYVTVYITLPDDYDVVDIDTGSIEITDISGDPVSDFYIDPTFTPVIGDRDEDGILDLTAKFDRQVLIGLLIEGDKTINVEGDLTTGERFVGSDTIRVIDRGK